MLDVLGGAGIKIMLKLQSTYRNTSFLCSYLVLYLTTSVSNILDYIPMFWIFLRFLKSFN